MPGPLQEEEVLYWENRVTWFSPEEEVLISRPVFHAKSNLVPQKYDLSTAPVRVCVAFCDTPRWPVDPVGRAAQRPPVRDPVQCSPGRPPHAGFRRGVSHRRIQRKKRGPVGDGSSSGGGVLLRTLVLSPHEEEVLSHRRLTPTKSNPVPEKM